MKQSSEVFPSALLSKEERQRSLSGKHCNSIRENIIRGLGFFLQWQVLMTFNVLKEEGEKHEKREVPISRPLSWGEKK